MTISQRLVEQPWYADLRKRGPNFRLMIEHVERLATEDRVTTILETGTAWDRGNWSGQGQSTLIWDWVCSQTNAVRVLSIDIRQDAINAAMCQTKHVEFVCGDSILAMNCVVEEQLKDTWLVYLDSYDWTPERNVESAFHHLAELASVWRLLPSGCMIVVDDRHGDEAGKHWMVEEFMKRVKAPVVFKNCQIGWLKP